MLKSFSVSSMIDVKSDGFIWVSLNPIKPFITPISNTYK